MGNNCCKKQQDTSKIWSTKALLQMPNFNKMDFYFSTQNLSRLQGECLVLFSDRKLRLKNNNISSIITHRQCARLKEEVTAYLDSKSINFDKTYDQKNKQISLKQQNHDSEASTKEQKIIQHFLINIDLPNIKFTKIMIILIQPWQGTKSIKKSLELKIMQALIEVKQLGVKEIAFVQFDQELGIPTNHGAAILARSIFNLSQDFKITTICCKTIADQLTYLSFFQNFKDQGTLTSYSRKSVNESNYY